MGRRSDMTSLVDGVRASETARERAVVMLLTLSGQWSVRDGYERLGLRRTRFQDLRRKMLEAGVLALEDGIAGRPRRAVETDSLRIAWLRAQVASLTHELRVARTQLDLSECGVGGSIRRRRAQRDEEWARSAPRRT